MTLTLYTVNGTSFGGANNPFDPGQYPVMVANALFPSDFSAIANKLDGLAPSKPIINWWANPYDAAVYPMGASVGRGVANLVNAVQSSAVGTPKAIASYSQGAVVASTFWRDHVLNPDGDCHAYENDFVAAVNWGNPMRCPGIAKGNTYAGWAIPPGGGISGTNNLTADETPDWWYDFANPNDLYTDCPVGSAAGADEELIYNMVMTQSFGGTLKGLLALLESVVIQFRRPLVEIIGIATAIWNGLVFLGAGPSAGHYSYNVAPAISYMRSVALQYQ